jgi:uncharacterized delta-60 repeat protein
MLRRLIGGLVVAFASLHVTTAAYAEPAMQVQASARQSDGRILFAGTLGSSVQVGRLNDDGSVDASFASGLAQFNDTASDTRVTAMVAMDDGGVLVAYVHNAIVAFLRFDAAGNLSSSFGFQGYAEDQYSAGFRLNALVAQAGGYYLGVGAYAATAGDPLTPAMVRYFPNGARDFSFGNGPMGMQLYNMGSGAELRAAVAAPDGTIAAAGYTNAAQNDKWILIARFLPNGVLDFGFGSGGWTAVNFLYYDDDEAFAVAVTANGDIVAAGRQRRLYSPIAVWRVSSYGTNVQLFDTHMVGTRIDHLTDATAMSVAEVPGSSDLIVGVRVTDIDAAITQFGAVRVISGYTQAQVFGPGDAGATDSLAAAYPNASGQFVAIGTRQTAQGTFLRRARYFSDTLEFDTADPTSGPDSTPDPLQFTAQGGAGPAEVRTSNAARVSGINVPVPISVTNGSYSIGCDGNFTTADGTIQNGQTVCVRTTSLTTAFSTSQAVLRVGPVDNTFSVTTGGTPDTVILWSPPSPSGPNVQFGYQADPSVYGDAATFECAVDGTSFAVCPNQGSSYGYYNFGGLAPGSHTFQVRATNIWGTDASPASRTWDVLPMPHTTITSAPPAFTANSGAPFTFTADQPNPTFYCKLDTDWYRQCDPSATFIVGAGSHQLWVYAQAGGVSEDPPVTYTWTVDQTAPTTTITSGPPATTDNPNATFTFSANEQSTFMCQVDNNGFSACTSPVALVVHSGAHTFSVYAYDRAGNRSNTATRSWTANFGAPFLSITNGPSGTVSNSSATFTFTFGPASSAWAECALDAAAYAPCTSPITYSGLSEFGHLFTARARDATGDTSIIQSRNWTVDTIAPNTTLWGKPPAITNSTSAQFNWNANESGVTFQSRLDGGAWTNVGGSSGTYSGLAEGEHTFEIRAVDAAGNIDPTPDSWTWTIDLTSPHSTINSGPPANTSSTSATFTFSSEVGATFLCSIDASPMTACTSPATYTGLADGPRKFNLLARDAAGNLETTGQIWQWTIDTSVPDTTIIGGPSGTTSSSSATFTFSASESGVSYQCSLDGGAWASCSSGLSYAGLADGMHMFEVRAVDAAGNVDPTPAQRSWSIDSAAPNTSITSGPALVTNATDATFVFTATEASSFQCQLDAAAYSACTSPASFSALSGGSHSFSAYSIDGAGNADPSPATWNWVIDTTAPDTSLTSAPSGTVTSTSATLSFTSPDTAATFECSIDGSAYAACTSPVSLSGLADGSHSFEVRARDAAGNVDASPAVATWTVDTQAPDTTITSAPPAATNSTAATLVFNASEPATFQCKLDAGAFAACTSPKSYTGLATGSHTFQVRATDSVGHVDATPASATWTIDTTAPTTTITAGPSGANNVQPVSFSFTSNESGGTFECKMDTASFTACTSPMSYSGLAKGNHTFQVRAIDAAGNVDPSPASRNFGVK